MSKPYAVLTQAETPQLAGRELERVLTEKLAGHLKALPTNMPAVILFDRTIDHGVMKIALMVKDYPLHGTPWGDTKRLPDLDMKQIIGGIERLSDEIRENNLSKEAIAVRGERAKRLREQAKQHLGALVLLQELLDLSEIALSNVNAIKDDKVFGIDDDEPDEQDNNDIPF